MNDMWQQRPRLRRALTKYPHMNVGEYMVLVSASVRDANVW